MIRSPSYQSRTGLFYFPVVAILLLLLPACATTAPVQEMSNARQSVQAAIEAGAEVLAPEQLRRARVLLDKASRMLEARDYLQAREFALQAKQAAVEAQQLALRKRHESNRTP